MAKSATLEKTPPVRKSLLIVGGVAIAAVVIGYVLMNFVLGGDDSTEPTTPTTSTAPSTSSAPNAPAVRPAATPQVSEPAGLNPGGRDPFSGGGGPQAAPASVGGESEVAAEPVALKQASADDEVKITVLKVYGDAADLKVGGTAVEGAKDGLVLTPRLNMDEIDGDCVYFKDDGERFKVCEGKSVTR
jgi:hypothetical protein